jgi:hypothetical protein
VLGKLDKDPAIIPAGGINRIRELQRELTTTKHDADRLRDQIKGFSGERQHLADALGESQQQTVAKEIEMHRRMGEVLDETRAHYEGSISWRVTKPLRGVLRVGRQTKRKFKR